MFKTAIIVSENSIVRYLNFVLKKPRALKEHSNFAEKKIKIAEKSKCKYSSIFFFFFQKFSGIFEVYELGTNFTYWPMT